MSYAYHCQACGLVGRSSADDAPVKAVILCDDCGRLSETSAHELPAPWLTVSPENGTEDEYFPDEHYCSRECLKRSLV